jgi:hypothetical protein
VWAVFTSVALPGAIARDSCEPEGMAMPPAFHETLVEPDYGQFYLCRAGADWQSADVPSDGYERHLWSSGSFVMVGTVRRYGTTKLEIRVHDSAPEVLAADLWHHVVEESLEPGGDLEVYSWDGGEPVATVPVPHQAVRFRVSWAGLDEENTFEGMNENGESDEHLLLQVWPQEVGRPNVLRCWPPLDLPPPSDRSADGRRQIEGLEEVMAQWDHLELLSRLTHPYPSLPGSTQEHSSTNAIHRDRRDGTLWADGSDVRRTLREISHDEAVDLRGQNIEDINR